jgi:hypothetical protein
MLSAFFPFGQLHNASYKDNPEGIQSSVQLKLSERLTIPARSHLLLWSNRRGILGSTRIISIIAAPILQESAVAVAELPPA